MRGQLDGSEPPHHDGGEGEEADLEAELHADRCPDRGDAAEQPRVEAAGDAAERVQVRTQPHVNRQADEHRPADDRGRPTAARQAHRWNRVADAVDQHAVADDVERQSDERDDHRRLRDAHPLEELAVGHEEEDRGNARRHGAQVRSGFLRNLRRLPEHERQLATGQVQQHHRHCQQHRQPQPLHERAPALQPVAGAEGLADQRRHANNHADADGEQERVDRAAEPRRRERRRAQRSDHDRVRRVHADLAELTDDDRRGQTQERLELGDVGGAGHGSGRCAHGRAGQGLRRG